MFTCSLAYDTGEDKTVEEGEKRRNKKKEKGKRKTRGCKEELEGRENMSSKTGPYNFISK